MSEETRQRISGLSAFLMVGIAIIADAIQLFFDLLGFGGIVAMIIGVAVEAGLLLWFKLLGVQYFDKNAFLKFGTVLSTSVITFIPFVDMLPELTLGTIALIVITRREDAERKNVPNKAGVAATALSVVAPEAKLAITALRMNARNQERKAKIAEQKERLEQSRTQQAQREVSIPS